MAPNDISLGTGQISFADLPNCSAPVLPVYLWHLQDYVQATLRFHSRRHHYPHPRERSVPGETPCLWLFLPHSAPCRALAAVSQIRYEGIRPNPPEDDRVSMEDGTSCSYSDSWEETDRNT